VARIDPVQLVACDHEFDDDDSSSNNDSLRSTSQNEVRNDLPETRPKMPASTESANSDEVPDSEETRAALLVSTLDAIANRMANLWTEHLRPV
jgi:hypothetical protein